MRTLMEAAAYWGLQDSTLRKQVNRHFPGELRGHTLFIDDSGEAFLSWLRGYVLSTRILRQWPTLVELANLTLGYRQGAPEPDLEELQRPLDALFQVIRPLAEQGQAVDTAQSRETCERALKRFLGEAGQYSSIATTLCTLFYQVLATTYQGNAQAMLKQEQLLLFAFATYQQEALQSVAAIFTSSLGHGLTLTGAPVQAGERYEVTVLGYAIPGTAAFDQALGWHLVTDDRAIILLRPGMHGQRRAPEQPHYT